MTTLLRTAFLVWIVFLCSLGSHPASAVPIRTITFYGDIDYPPYSFLDESGNAAGYDIDLIRAVAAESNLEVHLRLSAWADVIQDVFDGGPGKVTAMFHSELRASKMDFVEPHSVVSHSVFVRKGSPIVSLQDCFDKAILVQRSDVMHQRLENIRITERIFPVERISDAVHLLSGQDRYDAAVLPKAQAVYYIHRLNLSNVLAVGPNIESRKYGFAVPKGDTELVDLLNAGLNAIQENGAYDRIRDKWFGVYERKEAFERTKRILVWVAVGLGLLLFVVSFWMFHLKRALAKRTAELEDSRRQLADLIQHVHVPLIVLNPNRTIQAINQSALELVVHPRGCCQPGYPIDMYWKALAGDPAGAEALSTEWAQVFESVVNQPVNLVITKTVTIHRSEDTRFIEIDCSRYENRIVMSLLDVTEWVTARRFLEKSEEKFASVFWLCPDGLVISRLKDGIFVDVNESFLRMFRHARQDVIGHSSLAIGLWVEPDQRKLWSHEILIRGEVNHFITKFRAADNDVLDVALSSRLMPVDGVDCVLTVIRDMTDYLREERENRELKEKLAQSQKMEALGLLAGTVAHDLNNILSGVVTYPELILMQLSEDNPIRNPIRKIHESGKRAAAVVNDLLTVARGVAIEKQGVELNAIVRDYLGSPECFDLRIRYPEVHLVSELEEPSPRILASDIHIKKTLMNLVMNAAEAVQETNRNGIVKVSTRTVHFDQPFQGYQIVSPGDYAILRVSDTGCGISSDDLNRIFEPFYTRKVMGKSGTGLGLTVVWNTVCDHGGTVDVKSGPEGTAFDLYFPIDTGASNIPRPASPNFTLSFGKGERVLVVDDEADQRIIADMMLKQLRYVSETVESGEKALALLAQRDVDVVILDMIMPSGMDGRETFERIQEIRSGMPTIIASGYADTEDIRKTLRAGARAFLQKPYSLAALASTLRLVLGDSD
ncbi:MAG: transporter substrate-binding domain-containing protein [Thermodesulfobacteriota bacterium]